MVRYLTDRPPVMITPRWVRSRTQPIAIADVLLYLVGCSTLPRETNRTFDVGGPDVLTYMDMMQRYARIAGLPRRLALPVPAFTSWLSSWWVALVTPVSQALRSFFQSDRWSHPRLDTPLVSAATPGRPASRPRGCGTAPRCRYR